MPARLQERYTTTIREALTKEFSYKNPFEVPKLDKIVDYWPERCAGLAGVAVPDDRQQGSHDGGIHGRQEQAKQQGRLQAAG